MQLAELPLVIEACALEPLALRTGGGWVRETTVVHLRGAGHHGVGEDVTYEAPDHHRFRAAALPRFPGRTTVGAFCSHVAGLDLFPRPPINPASRNYRRWAFESAAVDLALQQQGRALASVLGRTPTPLRFVVSTGLGEPPTLAPLQSVRARFPDMEFKVDYHQSWDHAFIATLAAFGGIATIDLKGQYRGAFVGPPADASTYGAIVESFPDAWIEDPELDAATLPVLEPHRQRVTWDAILHRVEDLAALPWMPRCINVKPSRFGSWAELLAVYAWCEQRGVAVYGGGQFELGPGRGQIQYLASLFCAGAPNDTAPAGFNRDGWTDDVVASPLPPRLAATGFQRL